MSLAGLSIALADNGLRKEPGRLSSTEAQSTGKDECNTLYAEVHKANNFSVSVFDSLIDPSKVNTLSRWYINANSASTCDEDNLVRKGSVNLYMARNESESFQLMIEFDREGMDRIEGLKVTNLHERSSGEVISNKDIDISKVGFVFEEGSKLKYWDILYPLKSEFGTKTEKQNLFWVTVFAPDSLNPGIYDGDVIVDTENGERVTIPLSVKIWSFELPHKKTINTQLFHLNVKSIEYHYGVARWQPEFQTILGNWANKMAKNRFSLPGLPPVRWKDITRLPTISQSINGSSLVVEKEDYLVLSGLKDGQFKDEFTQSFWLSVNGTENKIFDLNYGNRSTGITIEVNNGVLALRIGLGYTEGNGPLSYVAQTKWPSDGRPHHFAIAYKYPTAKLYVDGKVVYEAKLPGKYKPAYSSFVIGSENPLESFVVDQMRWSDRALDDIEIMQEKNGKQSVHSNFYAISFDEPMFDARNASDELFNSKTESQWFWSWVEWSRERGLHFNNLTELAALESWNKAELLNWKENVYIPLVEKGLISDVYLSLPVDEGVYGNKANANIRFSKKLSKLFPEVRKHHTFSGMFPKKHTKDKQIAALKKLEPYVDILCMLPSLYHRLYRPYFKSLEARKELCLYLNRAEHIERPQSRITARTFPRYLWKYGIQNMSYWSTTNWFQSEKAGRPHKSITQVSQGIATNKRNFSLTSGILFWPGTSEMLSSTRAEALRDGLEDYEYYSLVQKYADEIKSAKTPGNLGAEAVSILSQIKGLVVYDKNLADVPLSSLIQLKALRSKVGRFLEAIPSSANQF